MKTAMIALLAAAAMSLPAMAQDRKANQDANNLPATQSEMNNRQPDTQNKMTGENQMGTQGQTASQDQGGQMQLSSSEVKSIQEKLKGEGFHTGAVDGKFGPETKAALQKFQEKNKLNTSGEPDQQTLAALGINEQGGMQQNEAQQGSQPAQSQRSAKAGKPMNQEEQNPPQNQNQPQQNPGQNEPGAKSQPDQGGNAR